MTSKVILIRVDASPILGSGHLMRMLALGQMLSDHGHKVHYATILHNSESLEILNTENFKIHLISPFLTENSEIINLVDLARKINSSWIVIDGSHFSSEYEKSIKQKAKNIKLMRVEDIPVRHHYADVLLSPNFNSENMIFSTELSTIKLLGLRYLILRREFYDVKKYCLNLPQRNFQKILITLGGGTNQSDIANLTIAEAFKDVEVKNLEIILLTGSMSQNIEKTKFLFGLKRKVYNHCNKMAQLISDVDIAIVSGGSSMWELMFMGTPFLTVALTKIQDDYLKKMHDSNLCIHLGFYENLDPIVLRQSALNLLNDSSLMAEFKERYAEILNVKSYNKHLLDILVSS